MDRERVSTRMGGKCYCSAWICVRRRCGTYILEMVVGARTSGVEVYHENRSAIDRFTPRTHHARRQPAPRFGAQHLAARNARSRCRLDASAPFFDSEGTTMVRDLTHDPPSSVCCCGCVDQ